MTCCFPTQMPVVAAAPRPSVSNRTATKMPRVASLAPSAKPAPVPPAETKPGASTKPLSGVPRVATLAPCTKSRSPKAGKTELVFGQPAPRTNHAAKSKPAAARPATAPPPSSSFGLKGVNRTGYVAPAPFQLKKSVKPLTSSMAPKFSTVLVFVAMQVAKFSRLHTISRRRNGISLSMCLMSGLPQP